MAVPAPRRRPDGSPQAGPKTYAQGGGPARGRAAAPRRHDLRAAKHSLEAQGLRNSQNFRRAQRRRQTVAWGQRRMRMEQQQQILLPVVRKYPALTPRTVATVMFRRRRTMLITFAAVLLGVVVAVILVPLQYPAEMKILVERERFDPVVTSNTTKDNAAAPVITKLSDEDV